MLQQIIFQIFVNLSTVRVYNIVKILPMPIITNKLIEQKTVEVLNSR